MTNSRELFIEISNQQVTEGDEVVGYLVKNSRMNELEKVLSAPAQPVIPDNDDDDLIKRLSGRAKFLRDKGEIKTPELIEAAISALSAQPVSEPSNSPVIPNAYVLDELGRMMLNGVCEPRVSFGAGWNACRSEMLKAQPVSEPYKFLGERAKYRVIIEGFSNSRSVDFEACSQEEAEEIGKDIFHEECNYGVERLESIPAQESE